MSGISADNSVKATGASVVDSTDTAGASSVDSADTARTSSETSVGITGTSVCNSAEQGTIRIPSGTLPSLGTFLPPVLPASPSCKCPSSTAIVTSSPARMREDTLAIPSLFTMCSAFRLANRSTAKQ